MVISSRVQSQLFRHQSNAQAATSQAKSSVIRLPLKKNEDATSATKRLGTPWSEEEHDRFLKGLELFPRGPWKGVAEYVGTRTARQTMTHAQKYRQRIERCKLGRSITNAKAKPIAPASPVLVDDLECIVQSTLLNQEPLENCANQFDPASVVALGEAAFVDTLIEDFLIDDEVLSSIVDELPIIDIITDYKYADMVLCSNLWETA